MDTHDRWAPKLRVAASGYSGSGYRIPTRLGEDGKPLLVPGVTTVLGAIEKGGVVQWAVDNTCAFYAANIDAVLNRTAEQTYHMGRWYHKRKFDFDNPETDPHDYSAGVLDDLANLGTKTHDWVADFINDLFPEDIFRPEQEEMITEFVDWWNSHEVTVLETEVTVVGDGYAGTLDHLWIVDGVATLVDLKTSKNTRGEHYAQLAALGAAESIIREVAEGAEGAVEYELPKEGGKSYWREEPIPAVSEYAILHLRPTDLLPSGRRDAFCTLKPVSSAKVDAGWEMFRGALQVRKGQRLMKMAEKEES